MNIQIIELVAYDERLFYCFGTYFDEKNEDGIDFNINGIFSLYEGIIVFNFSPIDEFKNIKNISKIKDFVMKYFENDNDTLEKLLNQLSIEI